MKIVNSTLKTAMAGVLSCFFAICGMSGVALADIVEVDVGLDTPVQIDRSKPLKIALFMRGQSVSGLTAVVDGVLEQASELGVDVDVFNANFDSATMVNQMENALLRDYNAWIVFPTDGTSAVCNMITNEAPKNNILVSVNVVHVCVDPMSNGIDTWAPGTIGFVGGNETLSAMRALVARVSEDISTPTKVGVMHGLVVSPVAKGLIQAVEEEAERNANFEVAVMVESNWDTTDALAKATPMLLANRELDIVITQHALMSRGILTAIEVNGYANPVDVYEFSGTNWSADMVKEGKLKVTLPFFLKTNGKSGVRNLYDVYYKGADIPKFTANDGHPPIEGSAEGEYTIIDANNVSSFTPEYN
ncbi:sugar ABC transporter substrate-binding protein [Ruegeria sp. EL01]|jgi:ribose transport system substrate-binding protein|uniref:sugar ABC transporter substrate-binding protein n=1 Tax=Ruegeria sp. EL01 TaxID=2107578 RepID=UPI000EA7F93C|nr:sugar ABC transporter substrate-binding protein [Ruegeria sp. EL01]